MLSVRLFESEFPKKVEEFPDFPASPLVTEWLSPEEFGLSSLSSVAFAFLSPFCAAILYHFTASAVSFWLWYDIAIGIASDLFPAL